jgi:Na+/H+-translocating membrane pyrophosphatase
MELGMKSDKTSIMVVIMIVASIILTFFFTMTIILRENFTYNRNKVYQSLLMGAWMGIAMILPMIVLEAKSERQNMIKMYLPILIALIISVVVLSWLIRQQVGIDEDQFILSMIEHHQMAIEMATLVKPKVTKPRLSTLVNDIITTQKQEIDVMYSLL